MTSVPSLLVRQVTEVVKNANFLPKTP